MLRKNSLKNKSNKSLLPASNGDIFTAVGKGDSEECKYMKLVLEFNAETARYHDLVLGLGGSSDSEYLRDELKRSRKTAFDLALHIKDSFMPLLKDHSNVKSEMSTYERLWNTFKACMEALEVHMRKTLDLEKTFPLHSKERVLIHTGVMECVGIENIPVSVENLEVLSVDKMVLEREDNKLLERDILEVRNMISEMHRSVDIKPWTLEPISEYKLNRSKSQSSLSDVASLLAFDPQYESRQRKRCAMLIFTALATLVTFTAVLIVCLVLLDNKQEPV